jgi:DNA-directed RNA polymerase subunit RPC12/RpoP
MSTLYGQCIRCGGHNFWLEEQTERCKPNQKLYPDIVCQGCNLKVGDAILIENTTELTHET